MNKIAIDLGSAVTKIFKIGSGGIVLVEPSCVAINTTDSSVKAIGAEAKSLLGKTGDFTQVCFPISEGLIVNVKQASTMLNHFLCQIDVKGAEAVFCVHCGFDKAAKDTYMELADLCALKKVSFVESPILSCLGDGVPFTDSEPAFCIDIGHETTDIAAFSSDGIIAGICMNIGGKQVDTKIVDYLASNCLLKIGPVSCEKLKHTIGSLDPNDNSEQTVAGSHAQTGHPYGLGIHSPDLYIPLKEVCDSIISYAKLVLGKLPAEVAAIIRKNGVHLSGGVAKTYYLREYFQQQLGMEVHIGEEPQYSVIHGGGSVVGNPTQLLRLKAEV